MERQNVDMSKVYVSRSYTIMIGMEAIGKVRKVKSKIQEKVERMVDKTKEKTEGTKEKKEEEATPHANGKSNGDVNVGGNGEVNTEELNDSERDVNSIQEGMGNVKVQG